MYTAALFTMAKTWKQPKCLPTDESVKKMWYNYTMEYYSAIKKSEILTFVAIWMDLEMIKPSEISQTEKDNCHMTSLIYRIKKKLIYKTEIDHTYRKQMVFKGEREGVINYEFGINIYTLLDIK